MRSRDLAVHPTLAAGDQILAIPTLVRRLPGPLRRIIGDLSNMDRVLVGLDIRPRADAVRIPPEPAVGVEAALYRLRLFIAGTSPTLATHIGEPETHLRFLSGGRPGFGGCDIYQQPDLAEQNQVVAAANLVRFAPIPVRRIIGDLSDEPVVPRALELTRMSV